MVRFYPQSIFSRYRHRLVTTTVSLLGTLCLALPVSGHADATPECNINNGVSSRLECGVGSLASLNQSTAVGANATATEAEATAVGQSAMATGSNGATAVGQDAISSGGFSTAIGEGARATQSDTTAVGNNASAIAAETTALGTDSLADARDATALGSFAVAQGIGSIALGGNGTDANPTGARALADFSIAVGPDVLADQQNATAMGANARATATNTTSLGASAVANSSESTALGTSAQATGNSATALGVSASATGTLSTALGVSAVASGFNSTALGSGASATALSSTALGANAVASGFGSIALGVDGADPAPFIFGAQAIANFTIALGPDALAGRESAMALGDQARATGERAAAIGFNTTATDDGSVAVGGLSDVTGFRATGVGYNADAGAESAVAVGRFSRANGVRSTAVGNGAVVEPAGTNATAIGRNATASHIRSTAIGALAQTNGTDNIAIGSANANYTLAGLSHNGPGLFTVLVDSNGNLFAQNLNSGAGKISAESNTLTLTSKPDRTSSSASQYTSQFASNPLNTNATTVNNVQTDDSNRLDQLFALVEAQQQQIDALLLDRETLTDRITELDAATATATSEPAPLLNAATINQKNLQHMGFDQNTASVIVDEFDLTQTQALSLRHNATREGWLFSGRFRQAMVDMTDHFVNAIGIENYRQLISVNGETTNVVVDAVLPQTTAASNGIQANDVIVEYAGNAIYSSESLITASAKGSTDDTVLVRLLRDDQPVELYIPAGPVGIRTATSGDDPCVWCAGGI